MRQLTFGLIGALAFSAAASAQPTPTPEEDDENVEVSELVVAPATPGPAWWKVSDADSAVYIMAAPQMTPKGMDWDQSVLDRRMTYANRLILPVDLDLLTPESLAGMLSLLVQAPKLLSIGEVKEAPRAKDAPALEDSLPAEVRDRFVAARTALGQPASRYAEMTPEHAARQLEDDYRRQAGLARNEVMTAINASAKRYKVRTEAIAKVSIPVANVKVETKAFPGLEGAACLAGSMDNMVARVEAQRSTALAWAQGDVRPLINQERRKPVCTYRQVSAGIGGAAGKKLSDGVIVDSVATLERALKAPGRSVAILDARVFLRKDGVLEVLKSKGYKVDTPASLDDERGD